MSQTQQGQAVRAESPSQGTSLSKPHEGTMCLEPGSWSRLFWSSVAFMVCTTNSKIRDEPAASSQLTLMLEKAVFGILPRHRAQEMRISRADNVAF